MVSPCRAGAEWDLHRLEGTRCPAILKRQARPGHLSLTRKSPVSVSDFERSLYELRQQKLAEIGRLGLSAGSAASVAEATYPNHFRATHTVPDLRAAYDGLTAEELEARNADASGRIEVALAGRIMAIRVQGKAGFAQLQQGGQRFQIYVRKDDVGEDLFALYKLLDLGDHVGVRGFLFRTRTGELTVHVGPVEGKPALTFLAKTMLALPDKYHGLEDTELRYRQRYVDLIVNSGAQGRAADGLADEGAETPPNVLETFKKRAAVLRALRKFFDERGYIEVETPMLVPIAGGAAARPFLTHHNALDYDLSLRIAPELYLKRLVVGGMDRVYEINRNFRNEGVDTSHNPEFTMLEFYQAYSNYWDLMDLTEEIVKFVAMEVNGGLIASCNGNEIDLGKWTRLSMREAIIKFWLPEAEPTPSLDEFANPEALANRFRDAHSKLKDVRASLGKTMDPVWVEGAEPKLQKLADHECWFEAAFMILDKSPEKVGRVIADTFELLAEPHLVQPTIIYEFPLAVSPLSKQKPDEPDWVERFEFYIGGFEVGNAFSELNDPEEQRRRFAMQVAERERGDLEAPPIDEDYVRALGYGLPPTAGEGIGIDRLTMVLTGAKSIRDVILFPLMRPRGGQQGASESAESVPSPS